MDKNDANKENVRASVLGAGMALGLVFGGIVGLLVDNLVIFSGGGMILGLALGTAIENKRTRV